MIIKRSITQRKKFFLPFHVSKVVFSLVIVWTLDERATQTHTAAVKVSLHSVDFFHTLFLFIIHELVTLIRVKNESSSKRNYTHLVNNYTFKLAIDTRYFASIKSPLSKTDSTRCLRSLVCVRGASSLASLAFARFARSLRSHTHLLASPRSSL